MTSDNGHAMPDSTRSQTPTPRRPPERSVLALLLVGDRRCRLAAALVAVVVGLASQIGNQAVAQAEQSRLYLDAPAVSAERASRAGEVANAYSAADSPATREVLAWLTVPVRPADASPPPESAAKAFASITARDGEGTDGVTPEDALTAGGVMLAQLDGSPSREDGSEELASAEAVRPQLGDGTRTPEVDGSDAAEVERIGDSVPTTGAGSSAYAPTREVPAGAPSGGSGLVTPAPSPIDEVTTDEAPEKVRPVELVSAPSDTGATPTPSPGEEEETRVPTGPISDDGQAPTIPTPAGPENPGDGDERPYFDASPPASGPESLPDATEDEPAGTEPTVEDTGPTGVEGAELAPVPVSPPADEGPAETLDDSERFEAGLPVSPPAGDRTSETAHAEPSPSTEGVPEVTAGSDAPEAASAGNLVAEADDGRVEIVVGGDETPAEAPSGDGGPPGDRPLAGEALPVEEPPLDASPEDEPPEAVAPEGRPFAGGEDPSGVAVGALPQDDATEAQPGGPSVVNDEPEAPGYAPGDPPGDLATQKPQEERQGRQRGQDPRRDDPRSGRDRRPGAGPANVVEEVERNDGREEAVRVETQDPVADAAENGGETRDERPAIGGEGGPSGGMGVARFPPVPHARTSPPAPQTIATSVRETAGGAAARQYEEPARPASAQQNGPAPQPVRIAPASRTGGPTASESAAAEEARGQRTAPQRSLAGPNANLKGGQGNR